MSTFRGETENRMYQPNCLAQVKPGTCPRHTPRSAGLFVGWRLMGCPNSGGALQYEWLSAAARLGLWLRQGSSEEDVREATRVAVHEVRRRRCKCDIGPIG
jgi:hypothetical protein